mgnify:FL=1
MMYYYSDYFSPFHFFFGAVFMIAFWSLIIWAVVNLVRHFGGHAKGEHVRAIEILKERYAKGEISKEQFDTIKKDLS